MARSASMLRQMDFCVKYFSLVAIETCQHISAEVICWRAVCCVAQRWQEWIIFSLQSRLIKTWSLGVFLLRSATYRRDILLKSICLGHLKHALKQAGRWQVKVTKMTKSWEKPKSLHTIVCNKKARKLWWPLKKGFIKRIGSRSHLWWKQPPNGIDYAKEQVMCLFKKNCLKQRTKFIHGIHCNPTEDVFSTPSVPNPLLFRPHRT